MSYRNDGATNFENKPKTLKQLTPVRQQSIYPCREPLEHPGCNAFPYKPHRSPTHLEGNAFQYI